MPLEQEFFRKIKASGILDAAKNLGIDKNEFINSKTAESYADHEWMVIDNSEVGIVINAIPDITKTDTIPWEEWFIMENEIHHHVLFSLKHEKSTMTWQGEQDDEDHPKQVLGVLWHVYNDMSISPFLNQ